MKLKRIKILIGSLIILAACSTGLNLFTDNDEVSLGKQFDTEIRNNPKEYPINNDKQLKEYVDKKIFKEIVTSPEVKKASVYSYQMEIIKNDTILNAFAVPGGYVYIYTGLLKYLDSEAALAGVIGHEIAHVERRHATQRITSAYGLTILLNLALGNNPSQVAEIVANLFSGLTLLANSRANEDESDEYSLLAVQGPNSKKVIEKICDKTIDLEYYHFFNAKVAGVEMILSRTGYTGELGYELYFKGDENVAEKIWNALFENGKELNTQPVGLGARDSLRLEMGFCLYGNDIDQSTNPLEAGLGWITKLKKPSFIGKDVLLKVKEDGLKRKLVPLISDEKSFPRHGYDLSVNSKKVGHITSGTVSPVLDKAIAMGYVEADYAKEGNQINFLIRGKEIPAVITKLPFIKN